MRAPLLLAVLTAVSIEAFAQGSDETGVLPLLAHVTPPEDEIVILGERRDRLSAPVSALSFGPDTLAARGVSSLDALVVAAPGLHMINDQDPGTNIVSLRGVTTDRLQQAAIAYVIDGVPLADTELFTARLYDLARVDVLRGPQGALFGKNAAGGAIDLATKDPDTDGGFALVGLGDGGFRKAEAAGSFALGGDWRARLAAAWDATDGWIENRTLNKIVDAEESRNIRLRTSGALGPVALSAKLQWMRDDGGAAWASSGNVTGRFGGVLDSAALSDPVGDFEGRSRREWLHGAVSAGLDLGGGRLTALFARDTYEKRWVEELDYRPGPLTLFGTIPFPNGLQPISQPTDIFATTADLRFVHGDRTRATFGVFVQDVDRTRIDQFGPLLFGANAPRYETAALQAAFYAGLSRRIDRLVLDLNLRADRDRRTQTITDSITGAGLEQRAATFKKIQPRIGASWQAGGGAVVYAAYGEGFRTGGFNPRPGAASVWRAQFAPETTRSAELGLKSRLGDGGRIEATIFRSRIEEFQSYTFLDGNSVTLNVDLVDIEGVEASARTPAWQIAAGEASLSFGAAIADARIAAYRAPDPIRPGGVRDYSGKRVPNAPLLTATAGAAFERTLADRWRLAARADLNATGETFYEIDNVLRSPAKSWLDARISLSRAPLSFDGPRAGKWSLSVWGKNITDERWAISAFGQGMLPLLAGLGPGGPFDTYTINRGRQIGVELKREFQ
jgi:iron complex outermembrane receptor protein